VIATKELNAVLGNLEVFRYSLQRWKVIFLKGYFPLKCLQSSFPVLYHCTGLWSNVFSYNLLDAWYSSHPTERCSMRCTQHRTV